MRTLKAVLSTLSGLLLSSLLAAQTPRGAEVRVNNLQAASYGAPQVAVAPNGDSVVVWQTGDFGSPPAETPAVWFRLFRADGTAKTKQQRVSPSAARELLPRVAMGADGSFVVVWEGGTPANGSVFGRRFDAAGRARGSAFSLRSNPATSATEPVVALAPDGGFVAAWTGAGPRPEDFPSVYARRFDGAGHPLGPDFRVNTTVFDERESPRVAMNQDGVFVIGWVAYNGEGSFFDVMVRRFAADGTPQSDEIQVNSGDDTVGSQDELALGMARDGSFVGLWTDQPLLLSPAPPNGFFGQRFTPGGEPLGPPFRIDASQQTLRLEPTLAVAADGSFFAAWSSYVAGTSGPVSIVGRRFASDGTPRGPDIRIDRSAARGKGSPSAALGGGGRGFVVWAQDDGIVAVRLTP